MPKVYVTDLQPRQTIESTFVARTKQLAPFRNKPGAYLNMILADKTGQIHARAWDNAERIAELFEAGDVVLVRGRVDEYQGAPQLIVERLAKCDLDEIDITDYLPTTPCDVRQLLATVEEVIATVGQPHLRALLESFFADPKFVNRFSEAPGAKHLHHRYIGGLLEHVVSLLRIGQTVCDVHPNLDRDLFITGIILHDIGKLEELDYGTSIDYTDRGRLIGHVVLGERMIRDRVRQMDAFPQDLAAMLSHVVLSHHGSREWGAPIVPMMPEAIALHYLDNLDAKVWQFTDIARQAAAAGKTWSEWQRLLERYVYAGRVAREADDYSDGQPPAQLGIEM
ncbi:MAG: 3'-5' exoribonuclease YhaM family protein [Armatimonadota bacterium]